MRYLFLCRTKIQRRGLLVASRQRTHLLDVETSELQAGQSKAYAFQIGPYATGSGNSSVGSTTDNNLDKPDESSKPVDGRESDTCSTGPVAETAKVREMIRFFQH